MKDLIELLPTADGFDHIRRCWGDVPPFRWHDFLHVKQSGSWNEQRSAVTVIFWTDGPENINECQPSRLVIEFCGVIYWEYSCLAQQNGIPLDEILASPPDGMIAVRIGHELYVVCRSLRVLSCVHESFDDVD